MISLCPSSMHCQLFALNDFSSKTAGRILKEFYRKVPSMALYQNCSKRSAPLDKMAAKNRKTFKGLLLRNQKMDFEIIIHSWVTLYQNCSKNSATLNKMAARAINRNMLFTTFAAKSVDRF